MNFFPEQVSSWTFFADLMYTVGAVAVLLIVLALGFVDTGMTRHKNVLDTWVQKLLAALIAGFGTLIAGFGIWQWSFNQAFGVPSPLWTAIRDWWIGGQFVTTLSQNIDPKMLPEADVQQIFLVFFITFSMATMALIHTGAVERMKPLPLYIMALLIGLVLSPLAGYLGWGPVGALTVRGTHDFDGVFPLYIFAGMWVLVLNWRLGPRLGAFKPHPRGVGPAPHNVGWSAVGVVLILFALPFIVLASGWVIPDKGFYGISFTTSGWGIVLANIFTAYIGGALMGALIAYFRREVVWALLGPLAGAVICGTFFDVGRPWQVLILSMFGPLVALGTARLCLRLKIDDQKVVPLALGPGIVGAIAVGFIAWGTPTGGYPGLTGMYALQAATITPWWQLIGVLAIVALSGISCLVLCFIFEHTIGLRVTEEQEIAGLDQTYWGLPNFNTEPILLRDEPASDLDS